MIVRIAAVQYLLRQIHDWSGFENQVRFIMKAAGDYKPQFVLLPEIFTSQLLSFMDTTDVRDAVRNMHDYTRRYKDLMQELAAQWNVHLIGGSHPTLQDDGRLLNTAYYFTPGGEIFEQDKIHRTRWEREKWNTDAGDQLRLFDTPFGKIAILICYDIEFRNWPAWSGAGAVILFVPSCTDDRQGFLQVRYSATRGPSRTGLQRDGHDQHGRQPPGGRSRPPLRPGEHHYAISISVALRARHRRRGHTEHRADRGRSRPQGPQLNPSQRYHDPALRQARGVSPHRSSQSQRVVNPTSSRNAAAPEPPSVKLTSWVLARAWIAACQWFATAYHWPIGLNLGLAEVQ
ncbi:MAG: nitrilase-related carbon-nitrogen hydrolase [Rhodocyclaceae bacterium]